MLTEAQIKPYIGTEIPFHKYYQASVEKAEALKVHTRGYWSTKLMELARPNEEEIHKTYRKNAWKSPTKAAAGKVITTFGKAEKAEDFRIGPFPDAASRIPKTETLEDYLTKSFPKFDSINSWFFGYATKLITEDPNGVFATIPKEVPENDNEYVKPIPMFFESENVIEYKDNEFAVLLSKEKSIIRVGQEDKQEGKIIYFFDRDSYAKATQVRVDSNDEAIFEYNIIPLPVTGYMCAYKAGSPDIEEFDGNDAFYNSVLDPALDAWDECCRRYSDHQVNMVKNVHPKEWEIATDDCNTCKGTGRVKGDHIIRGTNRYTEHTCDTCSGTGAVNHTSPFHKTVIKPIKKTGPTTSEVIKGPFGGYNPMPEQALSFLKEEYKEKRYEGFQALNLEVIAQVPLNESGKAKEIDRQESQVYIYNVISHNIKQVLKPTIFFINMWRYGAILSSRELEKQEPPVTIPRKFDIVNSDILAQRAKSAKDAGMSQSTIQKLEESYAARELGEDSIDFMIIKATNKLDPMPGITIEEKLASFAGKGCTQKQFIISVQIEGFINRAIAENDKFLEDTYQNQMRKLSEYADEVIQESEANIIPLVDDNGTAGIIKTA